MSKFIRNKVKKIYNVHFKFIEHEKAPAFYTGNLGTFEIRLMRPSTGEPYLSVFGDSFSDAWVEMTELLDRQENHFINTLKLVNS